MDLSEGSQFIRSCRCVMTTINPKFTNICQSIDLRIGMKVVVLKEGKRRKLYIIERYLIVFVVHVPISILVCPESLLSFSQAGHFFCYLIKLTIQFLDLSIVSFNFVCQLVSLNFFYLCA